MLGFAKKLSRYDLERMHFVRRKPLGVSFLADTHQNFDPGNDEGFQLVLDLLYRFRISVTAFEHLVIEQRFVKLRALDTTQNLVVERTLAGLLRVVVGLRLGVLLVLLDVLFLRLVVVLFYFIPDTVAHGHIIPLKAANAVGAFLYGFFEYLALVSESFVKADARQGLAIAAPVGVAGEPAQPLGLL